MANQDPKSADKKPEVKVRDLQPEKDAKGGGKGKASKGFSSSTDVGGAGGGGHKGHSHN